MGIKNLSKLLSEHAPDAIEEVPLSSLNGRKVAIDASMALYQFLIAVRQGGDSNPAMVLTNAKGETTSHIQGLFNRTIRYMTEGIKPVYVFDGKPPELKQSTELQKRREKREKAAADLKKAQEEENAEEIAKQSKRLVRVTEKEVQDSMKLLTLMGIPVVRAPCEAEAQAAKMCTEGVVYAVGTEDMDALTFKTPVLLRKMNFANASKSEILTFKYQKVLDGLEISHDSFVDLCILLGCDYCDSIGKVGPKTAFKLIKDHGSIEEILKNIDRKKYNVPNNWIPQEIHDRKKKEKEENQSTDDEDEEGKEKDDSKEEEEEIVDEPIYVQARRLFNHHEVHEKTELKWKPCQEEELTNYLVEEMGFNLERVKNNIEKLKKAYKTNIKAQLRMDSFFKVTGTKKSTMSKKRKDAEKESKKKTVANKKSKTATKGKKGKSK